MKKSMAVMAALAIGISYCSTGMVTMAAQNEDEGADKTGEYTLEGNLPSEIDWEKAADFLNESVSGDSKMDTEQFELKKRKPLEENTDDEEEKEGTGGQGKNLQMPPKLEVVIDPWELDGKGQIYSEQYVIKNIGEDTGVLTLSDLTCRPQEEGGAVVKTDRNGIHEDKRKSIYMELLFGNGERITLSEEGAGYEAELKPGEEISLQFSGEVNEHASVSWDNGDIEVGAVYSWDVKDEKEKPSKDAQAGKADMSGDVSQDVSGDISGDASGDVAVEELGKTDVSGDAAEPEKNVGREEFPKEDRPEEDDSQEEGLKTVELDVSSDGEIGAAPWTIDAKGKTASTRYVLQNKGNVPGTLTLSDPVYTGAGQEVFVVRMGPGDRESLQNTEDLEGEGKKYISIELIPEDKERKQAAGEESRKASEYKAELEPGEELTICFSISLDLMTPEELEDGRTMVTARYSWILKEAASRE